MITKKNYKNIKELKMATSRYNHKFINNEKIVENKNQLKNC